MIFMGLPRSVTEAQDMHNTLLLELEKAKPPVKRNYVRVDSLTLEGFDVYFHGWRVRLNKEVWVGDERRTIPEYEVRYKYRGVTVGYTPFSFRFPRGEKLVDDLILYWNGQIGPTWNRRLKELTDQEKMLSWPDGNTGELIEHLWQEGYQFEEYLPGSYLPNEDNGNLLIERMKHPDNEKDIMDRLRQWYLTQLATKNLQEVDLAEKLIYLASSRPVNVDYAFLLRKLCERVIDNKLDNPDDELEHLALKWVSLIPEEVEATE